MHVHEDESVHNFTLNIYYALVLTVSNNDAGKRWCSLHYDC